MYLCTVRNNAFLQTTVRPLSSLFYTYASSQTVFEMHQLITKRKICIGCKEVLVCSMKVTVNLKMLERVLMEYI